MSPVDRHGEEPTAQLGDEAPEPTGPVQYASGGAWVVVASGSYDLNSLGPLAEALQAAAEEHSRVVLDASGISFADSTLLNLLLRLHQDGTLRVAAPAPQLRRVLELTGADAVLVVRETVEDAAAAPD
ncbi:STAS domain-containing protein [Streptomyces sp. NPDC002588]|uniref:STAS domain-containing protein n=1 Tax=Streptomyces sp. NPDC002588 TaxID=3154419 RepID=UPI003324F782